MMNAKQQRKLFNQLDMRIRLMPDFPDCPPNQQFASKFVKGFHDHFRERIMEVDLCIPPPPHHPFLAFWEECLVATAVLTQNETALADFMTCKEYVEFEAVHESFAIYPAGRKPDEVWQSLWLLLIGACVMFMRDKERYKKVYGAFGGTVGCIQSVRKMFDAFAADMKVAA